MTFARLKSAVLTLLVVSSLVLSYMLWHGNWTNTAEVGLSALPIIPTAASPVGPEVNRPYQIVVSSIHPARAVVSVPDSSNYNGWLKRLNSLRFTGLHQVPQWLRPNKVNMVECDFGALLSTQELLPIMSGLENSTFSVKASSVILYQASPGGPVSLVLTSQGGTFVAAADVTPRQFATWLKETSKQPSWQTWNLANSNYVPGAGVLVPQLVFQVKTVSEMPMVDSFFVNPQAITRIQESNQSVIWTDGSRAVRWDQKQGDITFEDPNVGVSSPTRVSNIQTALAFIRAHGGSPSSAVLFSETSFFNGDNTQAYTLQTYVDGYPIIDTLGNYTIELQNGHVLRYERPLLNLGPQISSTLVPVLTGTDLQAVLHKLAPTTARQSLTVQLGYVTESNGPNEVMLSPAYNVSQGGVALWTIDAITGAVLKGMSAE